MQRGRVYALRRIADHMTLGKAGVEHFLEMGGDGAYVWAAYGFTLVVLGGLMWQSWRLARKRVAELELLKDRIARISAAEGSVRSSPAGRARCRPAASRPAR